MRYKYKCTDCANNCVVETDIDPDDVINGCLQGLGASWEYVGEVEEIK